MATVDAGFLVKLQAVVSTITRDRLLALTTISPKGEFIHFEMNLGAERKIVYDQRRKLYCDGMPLTDALDAWVEHAGRELANYGITLKED